MTLSQLIADLQRHMPHCKDDDVIISVPDRVSRYEADWAHATVNGIEIVASEPVSSKNRTKLSR